MAHHSEEAQQGENNEEGGIEANEQNDNQIPDQNHYLEKAQCGENSQEGDRDDKERTKVAGSIHHLEESQRGGYSKKVA